MNPARRHWLAGAAALCALSPAVRAAPGAPSGARLAATASPDLSARFVPVAPDRATPPPLVLADLQGRSHDLADWRGQVLVINFWATWCAPCLAELPTLELLQARREGAGLTVITVNYGESPERVVEFVQRMGMELPVLLDAFHRVRYDWHVRALPTTFVVDRKGRLRYVVRGELDWTADEVLARLDALTAERADERA